MSLHLPSLAYQYVVVRYSLDTHTRVGDTSFKELYTDAFNTLRGLVILHSHELAQHATTHMTSLHVLACLSHGVVPPFVLAHRAPLAALGPRPVAAHRAAAGTLILLATSAFAANHADQRPLPRSAFSARATYGLCLLCATHQPRTTHAAHRYRALHASCIPVTCVPATPPPASPAAAPASSPLRYSDIRTSPRSPLAPCSSASHPSTDNAQPAEQQVQLGVGLRREHRPGAQGVPLIGLGLAGKCEARAQVRELGYVLWEGAERAGDAAWGASLHRVPPRGPEPVPLLPHVPCPSSRLGGYGHRRPLVPERGVHGDGAHAHQEAVTSTAMSQANKAIWACGVPDPEAFLMAGMLNALDTQNKSFLNGLLAVPNLTLALVKERLEAKAAHKPTPAGEVYTACRCCRIARPKGVE
ncbi:hypothetical protein B0H17DRAFT_1145110 [Mycena rosella]|uniref:Uncharacterized protein n=1 Tax=Mycena rosella TaxID=1033263 RepID=A0AAD7G2N3_MYCRO|nr:hypothetical protein B0H17DRAFT_1145110 [Mycena rosella]